VHPDTVSLHKAHLDVRASDEQKENHGTPGDDVQPVQDYENPKRRFRKGPKGA